MKRILFFLLAPALLFSHSDTYEDALKKKDYKGAIELIKNELGRAPADQAAALKEKLAIAYYKDQQQEEALKVFLESLSQIKKTEPNPNGEEISLYEKALEYYLNHHGNEAALNIIKDYRKVYEEHPDYRLIGFFLASAYANLGRFDQFFPIFYQSYSAYPDHYLSHKTIAVLHIKLLERSRTPQEMEEQRKQINEHLQKAIDIYPQDTGLYKIIFTYAPEKEKSRVIANSIRTIIAKNIKVPRTDILYYVQQAAEQKQYDLARQFIDKAKSWYQVSKIVVAAQEYLDNVERR